MPNIKVKVWKKERKSCYVTWHFLSEKEMGMESL